ncbi:MlaD family protein [Pelagicoccus enzymogenes]|uniref:PqiB family protein n=1 Tax=Pelagicoccus enzymogenes TaxID=2773457 RepID=UPI00280E390B|nr:MlaD family protein [Pelagicoccus enzymogenes]MDQ8197488.1 MlaD family protein [Pelagicoccus enzymogenes]
MNQAQESSQHTPTPTPNSLLVWIVPLLALLVGGYMIVKEVSQQGPQITILFENGEGIEAGKTVLQHKGVKVGLVESVRLSPDLEHVEATVKLQKSAKGLARESSKFWILRPEIGIEGIRGLGTLISGPTIQVQPGVGPLQKQFTAEKRPPLKGSELGYHYYLSVSQLGSLKPGSPVLYRQYKVGEVLETELAADATAVRVKILVNSPYDKLVRTDSVFWNASGIAMSVGLLGAKIQTDSLQSVLAGGIMFATPENKGELAELAPENLEFELHTELDEDWLKWSPTISLQ